MRTVDFALRWLFILSVPLLLVTASLRIPASVPQLYDYLFDKYDVGATTGFDAPVLRQIARGLVDYFNSNEERIGLVVTKNGQPFRVFNEREIIHLQDVKGLFRLDLRVLLATLAFAAAYAVTSILRGRANRQRLARSALTGAGITLALMVAVGIGMLFDFDALLLRFHVLSFANDFWLLDPRTDYLIMLVTHGFMYEASFIVAGATAVGAIVVGGGAGGYLLWSRRRTAPAGEQPP